MPYLSINFLIFLNLLLKSYVASGEEFLYIYIKKKQRNNKPD